MKMCAVIVHCLLTCLWHSYSQILEKMLTYSLCSLPSYKAMSIL